MFKTIVLGHDLPFHKSDSSLFMCPKPPTHPTLKDGVWILQLPLYQVKNSEKDSNLNVPFY